MPRIHIHLHDIEDIEDLEQQEDWEERLGLAATDARRELVSTDNRDRGRGERRFGGSESQARKRADRRKNVPRIARRV